MTLTYRPFANLGTALYGPARLAEAKRAAGKVSVKVTATFANVYGYLPAGDHRMTRSVASDHRANVVGILDGPFQRSLTTGERNAVRAMLRKLDAVI